MVLFEGGRLPLPLHQSLQRPLPVMQTLPQRRKAHGHRRNERRWVWKEQP